MLKRKSTWVTVAGILLFVVMLWGLGHLLIDKDGYAQKFYAGIKNLTGYDASARQVELTVLPVPSLTFHRLEIDNHVEAATDDFLLTESVEVTMNLLSLLMGDIKPGKVVINRPELELETFVDGTHSWAFLDNVKSADIQFMQPESFIINGGSVSYSNAQTRDIDEFDNLQLSLEWDDVSHDMHLDMQVGAFDTIIRIVGNLNSQGFSSIHQYSFNTDLRIEEGESYVALDGLLQHDKSGLGYKGALEVDVKDTLPWLRLVFDKADKAGIFNNVAAPMPVALTANVVATEETLSADNILIKSAGTVGKGDIQYGTQGKDQMAISFNFDKLDLSGLFDPKTSVSQEAFNSFVSRFLPRKVQGTINLTATSFTNDFFSGQNAKLMATLDGGELVINQAVTYFPGESSLLVFGIIKRDLDDKVHFDGNLELLGKQLGTFLASFGFEDKDLITDHKGSFRAKTNAYFSKAHSIISDLKVQAGDFYATGGMTLHSEGEYDVDVTLRVNGMKLDPIADLMTPEEVAGDSKNNFEDIRRRLPWLDEVTERARVRLILQKYSLSKTKGDDSSMTIILSPRQVEVQKVDFTLGGISFKGDVKYNQDEELPLVSGRMKVSSLNIKPFTAENLRMKPVPRNNRRAVWNDKTFDLNFLKGFNTDMVLGFGALQHPEFNMKDVRMIVKSIDGRWNVRDFTAKLWGGSVNASTKLDVTSIPALNLTFALQNIRADQLVGAVAGHSNFKGTLSLNGQFSTSGINPYNWVKNGAGNFVMLGQNVIIKGFDVASMVQAIPSVRTVADVANVTRNALLKRQTTFSVVEGAFYMENGVFKTNEIKLRAKHSIGEVRGSMDAATWSMNLLIDFALISLSRADYPHLGVMFRNSMDDPEVRLDTRSLEAFIARKKLR